MSDKELINCVYIWALKHMCVLVKIFGLLYPQLLLTTASYLFMNTKYKVNLQNEL